MASSHADLTSHMNDMSIAIEKLQGIRSYTEHKTMPTDESQELMARGVIWDACLCDVTDTITSTLDKLLSQAGKSLLSLRSVNFMDDQCSGFWRAQVDASGAIQALALWNECAARLSDDDGGQGGLKAIKKEQTRLISWRVDHGSSSDEYDTEDVGENGEQANSDIEMMDV